MLELRVDGEGGYRAWPEADRYAERLADCSVQHEGEHSAVVAVRRDLRKQL